MNLFFPLCSLLFLAAGAATAMLELGERKERIVAYALLANALVVLPVYGLGLANMLTRASLGGALVLLSLLLLALAMRTPVGREAAMDAPAELLITVWDTLRSVLRENALVGFLVTAFVVYVGFTAYAAYYAPTWRSYDALWYHEPIVGYTIQNKGFAWVTLPPELEVVNANPRASEMLQVFFALFCGRRFIDLPQTFVFAGAGCAFTALLGRFTGEISLRAGFAAVLLTVPAIFLQLGTTYVDAHVHGLLAAVLLFATAPRVGKRQLFLAALAAALAIGTKATAYLPAGIFMLYAAVRHASLAGPWIPAAARVSLALLVSLALGIFTFARNAIHYGNPFFPIPVRVASLGIDWVGGGDPFEHPEVTESLVEVARWVLGPPIAPHGATHAFYILPHTVREILPSYNYGLAAPWVLVPLGAAAGLTLLMRFVLSPGLSLAAEDRARMQHLVVLVMACAVHLYSLRYLRLARYHVIVLLACAAAIVTLVSVLRRPRVGASIVGACGMLSVIALALENPRCFLLPWDVSDMAEVPYPEREVTPAFGAPTSHDLGLLRAAEIGPGSVVVFTQGLQQIAPLWNDAFSNRVIYAPNTPQMLREASELGATWVVCTNGCAVQRAIRTDPGWRAVGGLFAFSGNVDTYRRLR